MIPVYLPALDGYDIAGLIIAAVILWNIFKLAMDKSL